MDSLVRKIVEVHCLGQHDLLGTCRVCGTGVSGGGVGGDIVNSNNTHSDTTQLQQRRAVGGLGAGVCGGQKSHKLRHSDKCRSEATARKSGGS